MLLSEIARREGLFDWLAALAVAAARGSPTRLFSLIYAVGTLVTVFLSNDATAVVLTPAVCAATRAARLQNPLPYLFICAFVANAASFVLPISNPANLVVFGGGRMPPLGAWLATFLIPSVLSIGATYAMLYLCLRRDLAAETLSSDAVRPVLGPGGRIAGAGILVTIVVLIGASARGLDLGLPTALAGAATAGLVVALQRDRAADIVTGISWSILPLVAGLFILVAALEQTGLIALLADALRGSSLAPPALAALAGALVAVGSNLVNNLPAGLVAGSVVAATGAPDRIAGAVLVGIDLGPNLSVTGSLATILWLSALRREGLQVGTWQFLRLGLLVGPPALALALSALLLI